MLISVIIIAHDRKDFLRDAIDSVLQQELDRDNIEIIVVKNFADSKLDNFIEEKRILNIKSLQPNLGGKIDDGIRECNGEIITFLEDDDVYAPERLSIVLDLFSRDAELNFFHNSFSECDVNLEPVSRKQFLQFKEDLSIDTKFINSRLLNYCYKHSGHANLSSIAVRRKSIENLLGYIGNCAGGEDLAIFLNSCQQPGMIELSSKSLTLVRIHNSFYTSTMVTEPESKINWKASRNQKYLYTYQTILRGLNSGTSVHQWLRQHITYKLILDFIWSGSVGSNLSISQIARFTADSLKQLNMNRLYAIFFFLVSRIFPSRIRSSLLIPLLLFVT